LFVVVNQVAETMTDSDDTSEHSSDSSTYFWDVAALSAAYGGYVAAMES